MDITEVRSTDLFVGSERSPRQLVRVTLVNRGPRRARSGEPVRVRVTGTGVGTPEPVTVSELGEGEERVVEVPVVVDDGCPEGAQRRVLVIAEVAAGQVAAPAELTVAKPGWTMFMVPHFHYDPFWWNTQAGYLATWDALPEAAQEMRKPAQESGFQLVASHLAVARRDADYKFCLAELDYLKPYWDVHPEHRAELRQLIADGRVELVGGMYNEPNTNLTSLESTIRNTVYGVGYQRDVVGGDPRVGWMLDVFGHDPMFPSILADAGLTAGSWARGPFHQWGPEVTTGDHTGMQFPTEFEWVAPDGRGLLTSYLAHHYPAGWRINEVATLAEAEEEAYAQFRALKRAAATRNVLLPVGYNHVAPPCWVTEIHRDWNKQYVWPRFLCALPGEFFARVREDGARKPAAFRAQSRDMNPSYPGKDVTYIDIKQAQRAAESTLADAEKLATLMTLLGAQYPAGAIDKAWRQLCYGAHHDGITGAFSDQVYLDLLGSWREAHDLATQVRTEAVGFLAAHVRTTGAATSLLVVNTQSHPRTDLATVTLDLPAPGPAGVRVADQEGREIPAVVTGASRHPGGGLARVSLSFVARDIPGIGYRVYRVTGTAQPVAGRWRAKAGTTAENDVFLVEADPARGGALSGVLDKRSGKQLLRPDAAGNDLVCHDEYPEHPAFKKGPWHLTPTGSRLRSSEAPGAVQVETCPAGERVVARYRLAGLDIRTEVTLWHGLERVEFRTHVDGSIGQDRMLRARFPFDVAGARPVYEVGNAVVGRTFGYTDVDVAEHPFLVDNAAYTWTALSSTARVSFQDPAGARSCHAIGVAEIVMAAATPAEESALRELVAALAGQGVTATTSVPDGSRHGSLHLDSNLPDVRIAIGGPAQNPFTARVLATAGREMPAALADRVRENGHARIWVPAARGRAETWQPGADLRGERDLPVLIVAGRDAETLSAAIAGIVADLADAEITVDPSPGGGQGAGDERLEEYSVAVLNRGTPGAVVEADGTLHLSLMRSCTGWPSGVWITPPRRTVPDGSSFALQHWSHTFEYAIAAGPGDWRNAGFVSAGQDYNYPFVTCVTGSHDGELPSSAGLLTVEPPTVVLTAVKPTGNPLAAEIAPASSDRITFRCYEAHGQATRARIGGLWPLRDGAQVNVLEEDARPLPGTGDGTVTVDLGPAATITATAAPVVPASHAGAVLGPQHEPVQPVFSPYWLHNKGSSPLGHPAVGVHVEPRVTPFGRPFTARLTVTATADATGVVELVVPPGIVAPTPCDLAYDLRRDGHRTFEVRLHPQPGAAPGTRYLAARVRNADGQIFEDVVTIRCGPDEHPGDLVATVGIPELIVPAGGSAELPVTLENGSLSEIRGEAQLLSPFGTWEPAGCWTRSFTLPAAAKTTLTFPVSAAPDARAARSWALVKVMAFGMVRYTPTVPLTIEQADERRNTR